MSAKTQQELIDLHWNAPQLEIIDDAIDSIEKGRHVFCCLALTASVGRALPLKTGSLAGGLLLTAPTTKSDDSKLFVLSVRLA